MPDKLKISVVIPVGPGRNVEIVDSLKNGNFPQKDYEIIIEEGLNPSLNRNRGIKKAKSDIIAILDDDAYAHIDLLKNAHDFFAKYKDIDIVGGPQLSPKGENFFARVSGYAITSFFGAYTMSYRYNKGKLNLDADEKMLTSANMFLRKKVFNSIDGFDSRLYPGEDPEFLIRAKKNGMKIAYNPDLIIYHKRRSTIKSFLVQFYKYGKVRPITSKIIGQSISPLFYIPTIFLAYLIFVLPFSFLYSYLAYPVLLYIVLCILFSFIDTVKNNSIVSFFMLPFLYPMIHISYGVGLVAGLFARNKIIEQQKKEIIYS